MARKIVAGNWKMNKTLPEAKSLVQEVLKLSFPPDVELVFGVPFPYLTIVNELIASSVRVDVAAQNCHQEAAGAYTGEVSAPMLQSLGSRYVILGHSERRAYFNESDSLVKEKINIALDNHLEVIYCCGESLQTRELGEHVQFVTAQLDASLSHLSETEIQKIIIAYEPIWAIGTGKTATPDQAQEMHAEIRKWLQAQYGLVSAAQISILYGGSCKPANAREILDQEDVDGGLIGGASLVAADFIAIARAFAK